jgi:hypothetical protein
MGFNLYFGKSKIVFLCVRKTVFFIKSKERSSFLTPLIFEFEFVFDMKRVGLVRSFPTHIHPSHLDQRSPSCGEFGEADQTCKILPEVCQVRPART